MTSCKILTARAFYHRWAWYVHDYLTKPGSDFHCKLHSWLLGQSKPVDDDGVIALVFRNGEPIGWARTERWRAYDTLEAFVLPEYRLTGVASFAAAGLRTTSPIAGSGGAVAVFHPTMQLVAARAGLRPALFRRRGDSWVLA